MKVYLVYSKWKHDDEYGAFIIDVTTTLAKAQKTARKELREVINNFYKEKEIKFVSSELDEDNWSFASSSGHNIFHEEAKYEDEIWIEEREVRWFKDLSLIKQVSEFVTLAKSRNKTAIEMPFNEEQAD